MGILSFIKNIGPVEWVILIALLFIVFGGKMLTRLGRTGGETFKELKKVKKSIMDTVDETDANNKGVAK